MDSGVAFMHRPIAGLVFALVPAVAAADFAYPTLTPGQKALQAEYVIVGKITEAEKEPVLATAYPNADVQVEYKVVTIKITVRLLGASGITQVRVGFGPINLGPRRGRIDLAGLKTDVGTESCFFLVRHPSEDFFVPVPWATPLHVTDKTYETHLAEVKKVTAAIADPVAALKAKDAGDRMSAARTLLNRYGSAPVGLVKGRLERQPIPADESKLILEALLEMPWAADSAGNGRSAVWHLLQLTDKDGWGPTGAVPGGGANTAMDNMTRQWLEKYKDTYRVKCYVLTRPK